MTQPVSSTPSHTLYTYGLLAVIGMSILGLLIFFPSSLSFSFIFFSRYGMFSYNSYFQRCTLLLITIKFLVQPTTIHDETMFISIFQDKTLIYSNTICCHRNINKLTFQKTFSSLSSKYNNDFCSSILHIYSLFRNLEILSIHFWPFILNMNT